MNERIDQARAALSNTDDIDLPEGMTFAQEAPELPEDYAPPPPPPDDGGQGSDDQPPNPFEAAARQPLNDLGNGRRFIIHFGEDIRYVSQYGWIVWDGKRWERDAEISRGVSPRIRSLAQRMSGLIEQEIDYIQPSKRDRNLLNEERDLRKRRIEIEAMPGHADDETLMEELSNIAGRLRGIDAALKSHKTIIGRRLTHAKNAGNSGPMTNMAAEASVMVAHTVDELDQGDLDINTLSGVLRFRRIPPDPASGMSAMADFQLIAHDRAQLLTKIMPVEYDPGAKSPRFDAFLKEIQPNIEMRRFLQRWFALSMTGLDVQKLAFFHGGGANGKSVLVDLIARMLGDYSATAKIESLTGKNKKSGSESQPDLMPLINSRMVRTSEPEEGQRLQEALVKALTGGEPMMIRDLFTGMITFTPFFKITISGNHLPDIRGGDDGIWRRVMLVQFPVQIPEHKRIPKKDMDEILWAERSGILNWLIEGLVDYLSGGLQEPPEVLAATADYRKDSDPIGTFLADATEVTGYEGDFLTSRELIEAFNYWIEERGETRWGNRTVSMRLKAKAESWRHPNGQKTFSPAKSGVTGYRGIRLTDEFASRKRSSEAQEAWNSWPR
ncbi:DNA primase family protein [Paracoccus methylarcula]|nr:DNA primase family protein [Paracoccus methylarcula]